ncbi:hypothetical protein [Kitasatospora terrestris]|uniref:XRE family transcriptional regulator n=1 Tax=Kitasatospora terrestris TaxID=258051 RepID=A0ABP9DD92_9ACTN
MQLTGATAQRFPLVARIRPACPPLEARVGKLQELADASTRRADPGLASTVFNQAALLASDLALPHLARELCHQHAALYLRARPLPAMSAIRALEPIVNLARLHIRAGHGDTGHHLLTALYSAVTSGAEMMVDGITVPSDLTDDPAQRAEVRRWLWRVLLADGTRALTGAGRWQEALEHLERHKGIGNRILDGRQVAILARATTGDSAGALTLLEATEPGEPWENAVTAVLTSLCRPSSRTEALAAIDHCQRLEDSEGLALFTTRLVLTAVDATFRIDPQGARDLAKYLIARTRALPDGYAVRDILQHDFCRDHLNPAESSALEAASAACALDASSMPDVLRRRLDDSLAQAAKVLEATLLDPTAPGGDP